MTGLEGALDQVQGKWKLSTERLEAPLAQKADIHDWQAGAAEPGADRDPEISPPGIATGPSGPEHQQHKEQHVRDSPVDTGLPHGLFQIFQEVELTKNDGQGALIILALAGDIDIAFTLDRAHHHFRNEFFFFSVSLRKDQDQDHREKGGED